MTVEVADHTDGICVDADNAIWYGDVGSHGCLRVRLGMTRRRQRV